jgi:microcystin-dependent protein
MEPFIGEIIMFAGNFAPRGWAFCDGQLLAINSNQALFSILGTTYGGDGRTTFGLPDMRGRHPIHPGTGPGLSPIRLGQRAGNENTTLTVNELPNHSHPVSVRAHNLEGDTATPTGAVPAKSGQGEPDYQAGASVDPDRVAMAADMVTLGATGNSRAFSNRPPHTAVNFIIALVGIFPSRN